MNDCVVLFLERAGYGNLLPDGNSSKVVKSGCFVFAKTLSALLGTLSVDVFQTIQTHFCLYHSVRITLLYQYQCYETILMVRLHFKQYCLID